MNKRDELKKKLMEQDKLSEKDADDKLSALSDEDVEKELSRLSAPAPADDKSKDGDKLAAAEKRSTDLASKGKRIAELVAAAKPTTEGVQLSAVAGSINIRLARLRADGRMTPAEQKKYDAKRVLELAKKGPAVVDEVLKSIEDREPVIHVGQFGSVKATNIAALQKRQRLTQLEAEARSTMKSVPKKGAKLEGEPAKDAPPPAEKTETTEEPAANMGSYLASLKKYLAAGDGDGVKKCLDGMDALLKAGDDASTLPAQAEEQMAAMQKQVAELTAKLAEIETLCTELVA